MCMSAAHGKGHGLRRAARRELSSKHADVASLDQGDAAVSLLLRTVQCVRLHVSCVPAHAAPPYSHRLCLKCIRRITSNKVCMMTEAWFEENVTFLVKKLLAYVGICRSRKQERPKQGENKKASYPQNYSSCISMSELRETQPCTVQPMNSKNARHVFSPLL